MASIISAGTTSGTALNFTGDTSGNLAFQTGAGANTITVPNQTGTLAINSTFAFKNRLIDAGFIINQRGYTSGTSLSSGSYGHDRWKGGSSGGTYTFTQGSAGVPIVITITAGTIQQVIEGCNVPEGGTYTLSWTGTATARINSGSYAASPITVTGQTAGANMTIEFATGTVSYPQLETGSQATSFDYRNFSQELIMCQRYYEKDSSGAYIWSGYGNSGAYQYLAIPFMVAKRTSPTITGTTFANGFNTPVLGQVIGTNTFRSYAIGSADGNGTYWGLNTWNASAEL